MDALTVACLIGYIQLVQLGTPQFHAPSGLQDRSQQPKHLNCSNPSSGSLYQCTDGTCIESNLTCNGISECASGDDESFVQCGCSENEFLCEKSKRCIAMAKRCDRTVDCLEDEEDEKDCETQMCSNLQFKCRNHFCISKDLICDFKDDCGDGSDEMGCSHRSCWHLEFRCGNGECIPFGWVCDGTSDCRDNLDEIGCTQATCEIGRIHQSIACNGWADCPDTHLDELECPQCNVTQGYFRCPNSRCVRLSHKCDGICDCLGDCSDETECQDFYMENEGYIVCKPGTTISCFGTVEGKTMQRCISSEYICDQINDCENGDANLSDEYGCTLSLKGEVEEPELFNCSQPDGRHLPESVKCDFKVDCLNGDDERGCAYDLCYNSEFQCMSGQCIALQLRCDGRSNCYDYSDEINCSNFPCPTGTGGPELRQCNNGQCINAAYWCDFVKDCADGSDEDGCGLARNCTEEEFSCKTLNQCIPLHMRCFIDGKERSGCADMSHLHGCQNATCPGSFKCRNGPCINETLKCDLQVHCRSTWTDEQNCTYPCSNGCLCHDRTINCTGTGIRISEAEIIDHYQNFYFAFNNLGDSLDPDSFKHMNTALVLDLSSNAIRSLVPGMFEDLPLLVNLILQNNSINILLSGTFTGLSQLNGLHLEGNHIQSIEAKAFYGLSTLPTLNLRGQGIANISSGAFKGLSNLSSLDLSHNKLEYLPDGALQGMMRIKVLDLAQNPLQRIGREVFRIPSLHTLQKLQFDEFRFCCYARYVAQCYPKNEFSNCENLMSNVILRICIWTLGIIATFGNLLVIGWRLKYKHSNQVHSFLITNLAIGDLLMGCYLLVIAIVDNHYRGVYSIYDKEWRTSRTCSMAGFLSTFSSELSVFTLTVITLDRFLVIIFPFKISRLEMKQTRWVMLAVWTSASLISGLPLLQIDYFKDFYGRSGVCLALHITPEKYNGWEYSVFVFLFLNFVSFSIIAAGYMVMYGVAKTTRLAVGKQAESRRAEQAMARRMTLIVATDAACWVPIIFLGVLSLCGFTLPPQVFAWVAVFILPLNAAVNPILYTISTTSFLDPATRNIRHFNRSFKVSLSNDPRTRRTYSTHFGSSFNNHSSRFDVYLHNTKPRRSELEMVQMDTQGKRSLMILGNRNGRRWTKPSYRSTNQNTTNLEENGDSDYESEVAGETLIRGKVEDQKQVVIVKQLRNKHVGLQLSTRWSDEEPPYSTRWKQETCSDSAVQNYETSALDDVRITRSNSSRRASDRRRRKKTDNELYD